MACRWQPDWSRAAVKTGGASEAVMFREVLERDFNRATVGVKLTMIVQQSLFIQPQGNGSHAVAPHCSAALPSLLRIRTLHSACSLVGGFRNQQLVESDTQAAVGEPPADQLPDRDRNAAGERRPA